MALTPQILLDLQDHWFVTGLFSVQQGNGGGQ